MFNYKAVAIICTNQFLLREFDISFACSEGDVWGSVGEAGVVTEGVRLISWFSWAHQAATLSRLFTQ